MITETDDTIAAIATPFGRAALGMIRISGKNCGEIIPRFFEPKSAGAIVPFKPILGRILLQNGHSIDEVLLIYFQGPHSYTREDLVEITCHGSPLILERVLDRILSCGSRLARPGEFTYRAFLNGRLDLVQAGAVDELISADSVYQAELALQQLDGRLSSKFQELRTKFIELISLMEGNIDFTEEQHYNFIDQQEALARHDALIRELRGLVGTFERGRLIRDGLNVAIVGKPNVGKSSVFNALLGQNRAIVTSVPGTTRDYLRERITIGNYLINLLDTAGIRETEEVVEREGVNRSRQVIDNADLIVFVVDGSGGLEDEDWDLWRQLEGKDRLLVCNKNDLSTFRVWKMDGLPGFSVSALSNAGLEELTEALRSHIEAKLHYSDHDFLISNLRHRDILRSSLDAVERARQAVAARMSEEFPLSDLYLALQHIGQITGEVTIEDIYTQIFKNFCIGK